MSKTQPIKELEQVNALKEYFLERGQFRNYALVVLGMNTSLRISDILDLRWKDVYNYRYNKFRKHLIVIEKKTKKKNTIALNKGIIEALELLKRKEKDISPDRYIFVSQKGVNTPITRQCAYTIIKRAGKKLGFEETIACHSLRKTFGYQAWKKGVPPALLMSIYNHSSYEVTKRYLGISQDERDQVFMKVIL